MSDYDTGVKVLSGILPNSKERLVYVLGRLTEDNFKAGVERSLFGLIAQYHHKYGGVLPAHVLKHLLDKSDKDEGEKTLYGQTFVRAVKASVSDDEFRYAVESLVDDVKHEKTGQAISAAFEILERGYDVGNGELKEGADAAWDFLAERRAELDRTTSAADMPYGDMRRDRDEVMAEYLAAKSGEAPTGIPTGLPTVDAAAGGIMPGALALVAAFSGQGKSMLSCQLTWETAVLHGKNAAYVTSETTRATIRRRLIARHTRLPMFGLPDGLDTTTMKQGALTEPEEAVLAAALDDLENNPAYGQINVIQIPRGATLSQVEALLMRANQEAELGMVVIDYLNLLKADRRRESFRDEASDVLRDSKTLATSFDRGRAVPIVSPWQITQEAYKKAQEVGHYTMTSLAETAEAIRSPDLILTLYRDPDQPKKAKMQALKLRDGSDVQMPFDLTVDYRNAYLAEPTSNAAYSISADELGGLAGFGL